jgi:tight adherence protein C
LTGEQGASVAVTLSARASALRNAQLSDELGKAGSSTEKIQAPLALIGIVFMIMLFIPAMSSIILGSS